MLFGVAFESFNYKLLLLLHGLAFLPGLRRPMLFGRTFRHMEWAFSRYASHAVASVLFVFVLTFGLRLALLPWVGPGTPSIHDEFSYLLMADTFAEGRLSNPTHPMWEHFESFHILQKPTYASKYFPGQGVFLWLGQELLGDPWWGVLFSVALMCAALTWCLQAFLPPGWAAGGGVIAALLYGTTHYWASSYWGGAVAALGGCLALGGVGRLLTRCGTVDALLLGAGLTLMAATRPYEGCIISLPMLGWLAFVSLRRRPKRFLTRAALPAFLVVAVGLGAMLAYFHEVTGDAFKTPYSVYNAEYSFSESFLLKSLSDIEKTGAMDRIYRNREMQRFYDEYVEKIAKYFRTLEGYVFSLEWRRVRMATIVTPIFFLGLFMLPVVMGEEPDMRWLGVALAMLIAGSLVTLSVWPHYLAPGLGIFVTLCLRGMRRFRIWRPLGRPLGLSLVRLLPLILLAYVATNIAYAVSHAHGDKLAWYESRKKIEQDLEKTEGADLVIVRYDPEHNFHEEWVYNRADIDGAPVVWARSLGPGKDAELVNHFDKRVIWLLTVGPQSIDLKRLRP